MENFTKFRLILLQLGQFNQKISARKGIIAALLVVATLFSPPLQAQDKAISLNFKNTPLETVFKSITSQCGYTFLFNNDVNTDQKVSVSYKGGSVAEAMSAVLSHTNIEYKVQGNRIVLIAKSTSQPDKKNKVLIKVVDQAGDPLPGATVAVDGVRGGTMTNVNGVTSLSFSNDSPQKIRISFIGMNSELLTWNGERELTSKLQENNKRINEVIVTGFATISKERSTGAVTQIKADDLDHKVNFNLTEALEGKVAGLNSYNGNLTLRGTSSFSASSYPLVVVDGLPIEGTLENINLADVESVTVLKDAASASIYGSKAARGIIVVTTKSGKKGQTSIEFSADYSITPYTPMKDYSYASTADIVNFERKDIEGDPGFIKDPNKYFQTLNDGYSYYTPIQDLYYQSLQGKITKAQMETQIEQFKQNDYRKEYEKMVMRNSITRNYNLAIRKGTDNMDFSFSTNYQNKEFGTINNENNNVGINLKARLKLYNWLSLNTGVYCSISKAQSTTQQRSFSSEMPYERIVDANGNRVYTNTINPVNENKLAANPGLYSMRYNILDDMESNFSHVNNNLTRTFVEADVKLFKGLSYNVKFQYQLENLENKTEYDATSYKMRSIIDRYAENQAGKIIYNIPKGGSLVSNSNYNYNYTIRNQLNFDTELVQGLNFNLFAGTEFREINTTGRTYNIYGYDSQIRTDGISYINWDYLQKGVTGMLSPYKFSMSPSNGSSYVLNREFSLYANGSLSYQGRYSLTGSYRIDQANLFGVDENNRYRPLWSMGGSWNISNEPFMKDVDIVNMLKLRTSYGVNGNVDRTTSPFVEGSYTTNSDTGADATYISSAPNRLLRWEKTATFNVGLDFQLLKKRLSGAVDFYNRYTSDLMANANIDPSTGYTSGRFNNGEMLNRGVEISLSYDWISSKDWGVSTSFVYGYNYNEIKKVDRDPTVASDLILSGASYYIKGDPFNAVYSYRYAGTTAKGDPSVYDATGKAVENNGVMKDPKAVVLQGQFTPKWNGSFAPSLRYKGLYLDAIFVYYGGHMFRKNVTPLYENASSTMNSDIVNRWTPENPTALIPNFPVNIATSDRSNYWTCADINVEDASFVKLRNLSLSYLLPQDILGKLRIKNLRFKAQVNDLWKLSACGKDINPENPTVLGMHPSYIFGLNLTF